LRLYQRLERILPRPHRQQFPELHRCKLLPRQQAGEDY
jgi:hypothetical protein